MRRATRRGIRRYLAARFLSTLSLRRATGEEITGGYDRNDFYPRSPCGERPRGLSAETPCMSYFYPRSPCGERPEHKRQYNSLSRHFYPRSPCGERRVAGSGKRSTSKISIHALLAESDGKAQTLKIPPLCISIHALLAESDRQS